MSSRPRRLLVVGPSWVGDMVMAQPLFQLLQQRDASVLIDVLAPAWSAALLERMPGVHRALTMPLGHGELGLGRRRRIGRELQGIGYDQAIVLPNTFKSALVPFFAGIPLRTGWRGEYRYGVLNDLRILKPTRFPRLSQRYAALGMAQNEVLPEPLPRPLLRAHSTAGQALVNTLGLRTDTPLLALCPGAAFGTAKCWPAESYADLAVRYVHQGWQIVLCGADGDVQVCGRIQRQVSEQLRKTGSLAPAVINAAGRTSLAEVIDLLAQASAVVSNDSGLMHIAAALGRPLVALYGPTSPTFTPPQSPSAQVLCATVDCAPCFKRECPLEHHRCMQELSVSTVQGALGRCQAEALS